MPYQSFQLFAKYLGQGGAKYEMLKYEGCNHYEIMLSLLDNAFSIHSTAVTDILNRIFSQISMRKLEKQVTKV